MLFFKKTIMNDIQIKTVTTKSDLMKFIKFQWKIYENDNYWVPPLIMERKKLLDKKKNPFFDKAEAEYFLAVRNGEIVGRIAAIKNDVHLHHHKDNNGFFGFFECINDQEVANVLFDTAKNWIAQKGLTGMLGPANPSSNDEWGMLLEGFEDSPRILMTYNPPYYNELCENYGMQKAKDLLAWKLENKKVMSSDKLERVQKLASERYKLKISQLDKKHFKRDLEKVKFVYNKAWAPNWGFLPMTDKQIDAMAKEFKPLVEPSLFLFGEIEGKLAGFALVMLDYNKIFKEMNGRLFPFNFIKLFTQRKSIEWARIITLGIVPEHQKKGLDAVFYWEIVNRAHALGIDTGEASWILEDNEMMNRGAQVMGGTIYKKYRIWESKF